MRKLFALLGVAAVVAATVAVAPAAKADDKSNDATLCSYCWPKGQFTQENPEASRVLLFPVRVVGAVVGAPVGALQGASEGMVKSLNVVSAQTFEQLPTTKYDNAMTNTTVTILKAPVLLPLGVVGTAVAIPCGAAYGVVTGSFKGAAKGYMWPDTF